jgi:acetyl esterase/lipase
LHAHLPAAVRSRWPHLTPDLGRIALAGESAGGFLAVQSALMFNRVAKIRAVIAQYPSLHTDLTTAAADGVRQRSNDPGLRAVIDEYLRGIKPGSIRVSTPFPELLGLLGAVLSGGWPYMFELFGEDKEGKLTLGKALAEAEEVPPPLWVVQGKEDSYVEVARAEELVERVRRERPRAVVKYTLKPGGHGFDWENTLEDGWVKEGVEFIKEYWLGGK